MKWFEGLFVLALILSFFPTAGVSQQRAPQFRVTTQLKRQGDEKGYLELKAIAPAHHHFNLQAPMSLVQLESKEVWKPVQMKAQEIYFRVMRPQVANFEMILFLCDEAKTFCEKQKVAVQWKK
jgi:hypothetical protein